MNRSTAQRAPSVGVTPLTDPLSHALEVYITNTRRIIEAGQKGFSMSGDDATELGRELRIVNSMLDPRINQAIAKKYVVRPRFRSYPATFEYAVETMHSEPPSCIRCLDILYEIQAPKEVIDGYHVPTDPSGVGLSCKVKISFASNQQDDEAFIDEIKHSYCFESLGNQTQHPKMTDSFLGDTTRD